VGPQVPTFASLSVREGRGASITITKAVEEEAMEQREEVAEEEKMTIDCPLRR